MAVIHSISDLLATAEAQDFVGRDQEIEILARLLEDAGPIIAHVHGVPGIGKTALLRAFSSRIRARGADPRYIDCQTFDPTPQQILQAVGDALDIELSDPHAAAECLAQRPQRTLFLLDNYDAWRPLDGWIRQGLLTCLPCHVRVVTAGCRKPDIQWFLGGWEALALDVPLGPLTCNAAKELITRAGSAPKPSTALVDTLHRHPLALRLAGTALAGHPPPDRREAIAVDQALSGLAAHFLSHVGSPEMCNLLEASTLVRRVTAPLLEVMVPELPPEEAYERLRALPFMTETHEGLTLDETVREAFTRTFQARNPEQAVAFRNAAWHLLAKQIRKAPRRSLWRYAADLFYLLDHPELRSVFFPAGPDTAGVRHARPDDLPAIERITYTHEPTPMGEHLLRWWDYQPAGFGVVPAPDGACQGFGCLIEPSQLSQEALAADPVTAAWLEDLKQRPVGLEERTLFIRRWLSQAEGEAPGPTQAACWLEFLRTCLEMRPELRRVYMVLRQPEIFDPVCQRLGFRRLPERTVEQEGHSYHTLVLDFGSGYVDGWLTTLARRELGSHHEEEELLDEDARELVLEDRRIGLTPLEFGVLIYLRARQGRAVSREELLREVWHSGYSGWSNVVDTVVASLRRKLGPHARLIQTVTGVGYRYRRGH